MKTRIFILIFLFLITTCAKNVKDNNSNSNESNTSSSKSKYLGIYKIEFANIYGTLKLRRVDNTLYGSLKFANWGYGKEHPIKKLKINNEKIYFIRSVETPKEKKEYNSSSYFRHVFRGRYQNNGKTIIGRYKAFGDMSNWKATKIK